MKRFFEILLALVLLGVVALVGFFGFQLGRAYENSVPAAVQKVIKKKVERKKQEMRRRDNQDQNGWHHRRSR